MKKVTIRIRRLPMQLAVLCSVMFLWGCPPQNPTAVPTPPQIQVANAVNVLAQETNAAVDALIAARDNGTISQADLTTAFSVCKIITATIPQINAELTSADTWAVQQPKILKIIADSSVAAVSAKVSPKARTVLVAAFTAFNAISSEIGGPIL